MPPRSCFPLLIGLCGSCWPIAANANKPRHSAKLTRLRIPLLAGSLVILAGCGLNPVVELPKQPTKPRLDVLELPDGGICLNRDNAERLGRYVIDLERTAK